MMTRGSELFEMKIWITSLGKPTRPMNILFEIEENLKGMVKKGDNGISCVSKTSFSGEDCSWSH